MLLAHLIGCLAPQSACQRETCLTPFGKLVLVCYLRRSTGSLLCLYTIPIGIMEIFRKRGEAGTCTCFSENLHSLCLHPHTRRGVYSCSFCVKITFSIEKVLQLSNINTKLVLALGATYQVGKPQLIKKSAYFDSEKDVLWMKKRHGKTCPIDTTGRVLSYLGSHQQYVIDVTDQLPVPSSFKS